MGNIWEILWSCADHWYFEKKGMWYSREKSVTIRTQVKIFLNILHTIISIDFVSTKMELSRKNDVKNEWDFCRKPHRCLISSHLNEFETRGQNDQ